MTINPLSRRQPQLQFTDIFPERSDGICACGCGGQLTGKRRRWATNDCMNRASELFMIIKGDSSIIRRALAKRDGGVCAHCKVQSQGWWEADHILPVHRGGGGCDLDNYQTLCPDCHKQKTVNDRALPKLQRAT